MIIAADEYVKGWKYCEERELDEHAGEEENCVLPRHGDGVGFDD